MPVNCQSLLPNATRTSLLPNPVSHGQNFKNLILDYSHQALEFFAASEATSIHPQARITPIRQEQLKNRLGDRFHELVILDAQTLDEVFDCH